MTERRGFASMDKEKQLAAATKGGAALRPEQRSFSRFPNLARAAGKIGGRSVDPKKRSFSRDPTLASDAGRKGGLECQRRKREKRCPPYSSQES